MALAVGLAGIALFFVLMVIFAGHILLLTGICFLGKQAALDRECESAGITVQGCIVSCKENGIRRSATTHFRHFDLHHHLQDHHLWSGLVDRLIEAFVVTTEWFGGSFHRDVCHHHRLHAC